MVYYITRAARSVVTVPVTITGQPDQWRDVYRIPAPYVPAMPVGSVVEILLRKQLENPSDFPVGIAILSKFYLEKPDGTEIPINLGGRVNINDQLGSNITREGHYDSVPEICIYIVKEAVPAGCKLAWKIRAKTNDITGFSVNVFDKGFMTVKILAPNPDDVFVHLA